MRLFLFVLGLLVLGLGLSLFMRANNAAHEIEAFILFTISAIFITGASIMDTMFYILRKIRHLQAAHVKQLTENSSSEEEKAAS